MGCECDNANGDKFLRHYASTWTFQFYSNDSIVFNNSICIFDEEMELHISTNILLLLKRTVPPITSALAELRC